MKKVCFTVILATVLIAGCTSPALETVSDVYGEPKVEAMQRIVLELPEEAAQSVMQSETGEKLYQCNGYELRIQTMAFGNLDQVLHAVTGLGEDQLTVIKRMSGEEQRYDCAWCSAGAEGELVGRTTILDDGNYWYCVSVLADSGKAHDLQQVWQELLDTVSLRQY